jgi:uncharacterized protein YjlB
MPATKPVEPEAHLFADDGVSVPNNPRLPFLVYRAAFDLAGTPDPEPVIERVVKANRWGNLWRNGIYPYTHYHSMIHEFMAVARGRVKVRFGGSKGQDFDLVRGDVAILPAGTGHQGLWTSPDLMVIGAYPASGRYDLCRGSKAEYAKAVESIPGVPLPETDPVYGKEGPLLRLWPAA